MKCRHMPHDRTDEYSWIQKECRIRYVYGHSLFVFNDLQRACSTMNIISLLDCAFSFYSNYPCRISHTEVEWDLPCQEAIFDSQHPFVEPNFRFSRDIPISKAFENLFDNTANEDGSQVHVPDHIADMTVLDMFILIHCMSTISLTQMTTNSPVSSAVCLHKYTHDPPGSLGTQNTIA
jgi:hypothetical protein